ncbi:MAG: isoleucine--tRNA ligase [bacterium]
MRTTKHPGSSGLPNFPALENDVLERWKKGHIFEKTLEQTNNGPRFVFFEGPPTANGMPGIHHVLARAYKDVIPRYKTMRGFFVERKAGWDTQGLPVELEVERQIGVSGKKDIEKYGIEKFNEDCRKSVWKYKAEWEKLTERIGFWLDMEHPYITYEKEYIESLWWIFKQIWERQLLIKDYKVVPQCPRCETALSSHEVAQGYEKVKENSVVIKLKVKGEKVKSEKGKVKKGDYILSWTTTPWTLPGNVALAVGENVEYVIAAKNGERFVLAKVQAATVLGEGYTEEETIQGSELVGTAYEPLYPGAMTESVPNHENAFKVYAADFVTTEEGTGVVHTAVMYGEDDYNLGQEVGLPKRHTVNPDGTFNEIVPKWKGRFVKDPDVEKEIVEDLRSRGLLFKEEKYEHDYPFCWRCHSPLLYYAKDSWFIKMSALREELKQRNATINWIPAYFKDGRFGEWLNEVKDWAISRERYWGTPIPIWECPKCHKRECMGSFAELAERSGKKDITSSSFDPHRPFIDKIVIPCKCGGKMQRIPEVADTWFDSGSMPFAQWHYPFENKERIDQGISYPAEYIAEAIDQTRGWFYTLLAVATLLKKDAPYKNVICLGHILDAKGKKMSKHIGNIIDPWSIINEYGADPLRFLLFTINQPGEYKLFDPKQVGEVVRKTFFILWNILSFRDLFSINAQPFSGSPTHLMDRWLLARCEDVRGRVTDDLECYAITDAGRLLTEFITDLSTWYVRRSRSRLKSEGKERDEALATLTATLQTLSKLLAPLTPFFAEMVYRRSGGTKSSVHLETWPEAGTENHDLLRYMAITRQVVEVGHALREEAGIKVRQPLGQLVISGAQFTEEYLQILRDELNIKQIICKQELPTGADWRTKAAGKISIALDTTVTDELLGEGWYREVVRYVNDLRKQAKCAVHDMVVLHFFTKDDRIRSMMTFYHDQILRETRSTACTEVPEAPEGSTPLTLGKATLSLSIKR